MLKSIYLASLEGTGAIIKGELQAQGSRCLRLTEKLLEASQDTGRCSRDPVSWRQCWFYFYFIFIQ